MANTKTEITPKSLLVFVLSIFWTIYQQFRNLDANTSTPMEFVLTLVLYIALSAAIMAFGGKGSLVNKLWDVLKNRQLTPDQKCTQIEFVIIEAVSRWNAANAEASKEDA